MKTDGERIQLYESLASAPDGGERSPSRLGRFNPAEIVPGANYMGGCMVPRAGLDPRQKRKYFASAEDRNPIPRPFSL
jgi:hypothetical protein